ncbi:Catabolite control protein A [bioreactor metagenome]|uniref:Catabolite control protein A n=1 Tax=bioreactor metagenome TaxID=1076179 RepID=A0A645B6T5_9ZZZZ
MNLQEEFKLRVLAGKRGDLLPTAASLAAEYGVNIKTVNKALNQLAAAGMLDRKRRVGTVILGSGEEAAGKGIIEVIFSGFTDPFLHPFWGELLKGIHEVLSAADYRMILNHIKSNPETHLFDIGKIELSDAAGRITVGPCEKHLLDWIAAARRPTVAAGDELADRETPSVYFDFQKGISDAVDYLYRRRNCRKIAFLGHVNNLINPAAQQKLYAYTLAYQQFEQLDMNLVQECWPIPGKGRIAIEQLLEKSNPEALIVGSDLLVPEIDAYLRTRNLDIPIVGCDGVALATPPADYSVVRAPRRECGQTAARLLLETIQKGGGKIGRHALRAEFHPGTAS